MPSAPAISPRSVRMAIEVHEPNFRAKPEEHLKRGGDANKYG